MSYERIALIAILRSDLGDKAKLGALELLASTHPDNGHINMTWDALRETLGDVAKGTAKNRLTELHRAELIHYSTNESVDVTFQAWRGQGINFAKIVTGITNFDELGSQPAENRDSSHALGRDPSHDFPPYPPIDKIDSNSIGTEGDQSMGGPDLDERQRSYALLTDPDVGVSDQHALRLAAAHRFDWLLAQVGAWWDDPSRAKYGAGGLVNRLDSGWKPKPMTGAFRASSIHDRHVGTLTDEWDRFLPDSPQVPDVAEPVVAEPGTQAGPDVAEPVVVVHNDQAGGDVAGVWTQALDELARQMTQHTFQTYFTSARVAAVDGPRWTIQAHSEAARAVLESSFGPSIRSTLGRLLQKSVRVVFVGPQAGPVAAGGRT